MATDPKAGERNLKHGGEAAVKALTSGADFTGLAAEAELNVISELEAQGRAAIVRRNATRTQAAADIFWGVFLAAAENGDLGKMDSYIKRYGWLVSVAQRAWAQDAQEQKDSGGVNAAQVLEVLQNGKAED